MNRHPLESIPTEANKPRGNIPNTPLAVSTISFLLGSVFSLGAITFLFGGFSNYWWATYQLGFFVAAWSGFHWGEFAVTSGWNFEKCSVDCESVMRHPRPHSTLICTSAFLLDNGAMYHIANGAALTEYLITLYFKPSLKSYPYVSTVGMYPKTGLTSKHPTNSVSFLQGSSWL